MISAATVGELEARSIDYILGVRERATTEIRGVIADPAPYGPLSIPTAAGRGSTDLMVKDIFRTAKALLATRPIFHKYDETIRGHVFCSFLALILRKELEDRLAAAGHAFEWADIVQDLERLSETEIEQDGKRYILRNTAPGGTATVLKTLGIALPPLIRCAPPPPAPPPHQKRRRKPRRRRANARSAPDNALI
jgi:hypothetical protein